MKAKRLLSILFACALVLGMMSIGVSAAEPTLTKTGDVYEIATEADLLAFAADVNGGADYAGETVKLTDNISLSSEWTPIGNGTRSGKSYTGNAFKGIFDGAGYTISGLTITTGETVGLFGIVDGGTVKSLKLADVAISGTADNAGAAIGVMVGGATADGIEVVSGSITGNDGIGGIVGRMTVSGTIKGCINNAAVSAVQEGSGTTGGIVGKAYYTEADKEMNITDCRNTGAITGNYAAGGIVGLSTANVTLCYNTGAIDGGMDAGGICGEQNNYGEVSGNVNEGTATAQKAGGIIGWLRYQTSTANYANNEVIAVNDNTNTATITAKTDSGHNAAGGIVGLIYNQAAVSGNVNKAAAINGGNFAGGIVGGIQYDASCLSIENATVTIGDNRSSTSLENITGSCKSLYAYNNDANAFVVEDTNAQLIAQVNNGEMYTTLQAAVDAAADGDTVTLLDDAIGAGVVIKKDITIDFGGYTYTVNSAVGSTGTETLGFQVKAGSNALPYDVTFKNGTIAVVEEPVEGSKEIKVVVMNYSNLTLENMNVDGTGNSDMICGLATNNGSAVLSGATSIKVNDGVYAAVDVDGSQDYYGNATLTFNTTGTIQGDVEIYGEESVAVVNSGTFTGTITGAPEASTTIYGGTFTDDVSEYVPYGYGLNAEGTVVEKEADSSVWTTDIDAGSYVDGGTTYGMMRFLFAADVEGVISSGIMYIKGESITTQVGERVTGTSNAFYGDIVGIEEGTAGTYYAVAYITTANGTVWSEPLACSPNWTQKFENYTGGAQ